MKFVRMLSILVIAVSALVGVGSWIGENNLAGQAKKVQLVKPSEGAALFDEVGENIGSAQELIIPDQAAFMDKTTPEGVPYVNDAYLKEKGIYPLQLQTVRYVGAMTRYGAIAGLVIGILGLLLANRKLKAHQALSAS
jgi:hypothetical protein